jgi:hypothetical protein
MDLGRRVARGMEMGADQRRKTAGTPWRPGRRQLLGGVGAALGATALAACKGTGKGTGGAGTSSTSAQPKKEIGRAHV